MPSAAVRRLGALNGQVADNVELSPKIRGDDKQTSAETMTALARERRNPTFSISDMADHLNGGAVKTKVIAIKAIIPIKLLETKPNYQRLRK